MPSSKNQRVLHIMSSYGGGISTFIRNLATQMPNEHVVFDVVTYDTCPPDFIELIQRTGGDVYQLKNPKKEGYLQFQRSLSRVVKLYQYDLIHCHISGYRALAYRIVCGRYSKAPFVIHAHYVVDDNALTIAKRFMHYGNQAINRSLSASYAGCSRDAVQSLFGYNLERNQLTVIPNSINPLAFIHSEQEDNQLRQQVRQQYQLSNQTVVVGHIGRLTSVKNHGLSLQIAERAKLLQLDFKLLIVGSGELQADLQRRIQENQLHDYVKLIGRVSPMGEFLPALDAVVFPSFNEGLGTTAIESQAAGLPVVLSSHLPYELELGLDLLERVELTQSAQVWLDHLLQVQEQRLKPSAELRQLALDSHNYTNQKAAKLYVEKLLKQAHSR